MGKKVVLRPIKMEDAPRFVRWLRDKEVNKFTTRKKVFLKEEQEWIKNLPKKKNMKRFSVDTLKEKIHIGSIGLELEKKDKLAYIDILIGDKNYWGKGYGTEAIKILVDHAFKELGVHKLNLGGGTYSYNTRAIRAYKKSGFKIEGINSESVLYKGKFYNLIQMGILRKEWKKKFMLNA